MIPRFPEELMDIAINYQFTGSVIICDPQVLNTDLDLVIYVDSIKGTRPELEMYGFILTDAAYVNPRDNTGENFLAYRRKLDGVDLNLIVVEDRLSFIAWQTATRWACELNITEKQDRADFFQIVKKYLPRANIIKKPEVF